MTSRIPAPDTIPGELRLIPQWVCAGRDKRPVDPHTGGAASTADPSTWGTFAQAVDRARADKLGVGFVLTTETGIVGVDIDGCIDGDGNLSEDAAAIVGALNTYTERSRSGRGLHVLAWSDALPGTGRKHTRRRVEVYQTGRYLIVTGDHYPGTPDTLEERTQAVAALYAELQPAASRPTPARAAGAPIGATADDDIILARLRRVPRFGPLWDGDTGAHGGDHSAADLSMASLLAWAGATETQADALFRRSGLMRGKWDSRRGGSTYGAMTISKAFADATVGDWTSSAPPAPSTAAPADTSAAAIPDNVIDLQQRVRELELENSRLRVERDRAVAERDHMRESIAGYREILGNGELGSARIVALAAYTKLDALTRNHEAGAPDDGMYRLTAHEVGEVVGMDAATASRNLRKLEQIPGSPLKRDLRTVVDLDDNGMVIGGRQVTYLGMRTSSALDFAAAVGRLVDTGNERGNRHGGVRKPVMVEIPPIPACPDHPEAGAVIVGTAACDECGQVLRTVRLEVDAADLIQPIGADCNMHSDSAPDVGRTTTHDLAIGPPDGDGDTGLHDAIGPVPAGNGLLPLMPPERGAPGDPARWLA